jgi:hypothetical protein
MRVEVTRVVQTEAGDCKVKGRLHSRYERCTRGHVVYLGLGDDRNRLDWKDHTTDRGKFSIRVPQGEEGMSR